MNRFGSHALNLADPPLSVLLEPKATLEEITATKIKSHKVSWGPRLPFRVGVLWEHGCPEQIPPRGQPHLSRILKLLQPARVLGLPTYDLP